MSAFISDEDTAKLYVEFLDQNNSKSKYYSKNELIYIRDFEGVQNTHSRVLSGFKNSRNKLLLVFKQYMKSYPVWCRHNLYEVKRRAKRTIFFLRRKYSHFVGKEKSLKKSSITSMVALIKLYNSYTFHQTIRK